MQNNKKTFWPYGIVLSIVAIVISCIATIVIALKNPVQMDTFYMDRYQNVDENINDIIASQKRFDAKYEILFDVLDANKDNLEKIFSFVVASKSGELANFKTEILLTKPETNEFNQNLNFTWQKEILKTSSVKLPKEGKWQILLKLNDGSDTGFYKFERTFVK